MAIYRGSGSTGAAVADTYLSAVIEQAIIAQKAAAEATATAISVGDTNSAIIAAAGDVIQTGYDVISTADAVATTNLNVAITTSHVAASAQSKDEAEAAKVLAEGAYNAFAGRYLGDKSSNPLVDNNGDPLVSGAMYFNTDTLVMKVYNPNGSWTVVGVDSDSTNTGDFIASGALASGDPVLMNADGTVTVVAGQIASIAPDIDETNMVDVRTVDTISGQTVGISIDPFNLNTFIFTYRTNGAGYVVVGSIDDTTLSFGASYLVSAASAVSAKFDPFTKNEIVILNAEPVSENSSTKYSHARVGYITGDTIIFGAPTYIGNGAEGVLVMDTQVQGRFAVLTQKKYTYATHAGGVVYVGEPTEVFMNNTTTLTDAAIGWLPAASNSFVITYISQQDSGKLFMFVVQIVDGALVEGAHIEVGRLGAESCELAFDSVDPARFIIAGAYDYAGAEGAYARAATITGEAIGWGDMVLWGSARVRFVALAIDPILPDKLVIHYEGFSTDGLSVRNVSRICSFVDLTITLGDEILYNEAGYGPEVTAIGFDSHTHGQFIMIYLENTAAGVAYVRATVGQVGYQDATITNLKSDNFIGTATDSFIDGSLATIMLPSGTSNNQTGLVVGKKYYLLETGEISTIPDILGVEFGKALSATTLLIKAR